MVVEPGLSSRAKLGLRNIVVRRAGTVILDVPEFDVFAGETLAVIGPNGAGKTTMLLQMSLLERPDEGTVLFEGVPARSQSLALRRRMAVVFQQPLLLDRSVRANVEAGLQLRRVPAHDRRQRTERWLARFGISELAGRSSHSLSGVKHSARAWHAPSRLSPKCCSSTSHSVRWTSPRGRRSSTILPRCSGRHR